MEEGYDDNEGGSRGGGRKGQGERQGPYGGGGSHRERGPGGQPREDRGQATRCSRRRRRGRGGMVGYLYSSSSTRPRTTISRGDFGDECKFIYS